MTPFSAWADVSHLIPKQKVIWEPFWGDGTSGQHLTDLGFTVIHRNINFFDNDLGDIIVTNPPFSQTQTIIPRLKTLGKPFIIIMQASKLCSQHVRETFKNDSQLQIIIPRKRIHFLKLVDGEVDDSANQCSFDCFYYCYHMDLPNDITWLE